MLVDGTPTATCLLPATSLQGRRVDTIERHAEQLHPVQRAFMAHDGLQCGFCTPGFLMSAIAFVDGWRRNHGDEAPSRDEIASALAGHICRCGAYEGIYAAVAAACRGDFDRESPDPAPRYDAREKVTGEARYTADIQLPGLLEACILRSPHAHARVLRLDWTRLSDIPGVMAAVRILPEGGLIRYAGQELVGVAAVDRHTAERAVRAIQVEYEILPATLTLDEGLDPESEPVYPERKRYAPTTAEGPKFPSFSWKNNVRAGSAIFSRKGGKADEALAEAKRRGWPVVDGAWTTQVQCHSALEPHTCLAHWESDGGLTVHLSTQAVNRMQDDIAHRWDLPRGSVRVRADYVGGGFGAKAVMSPEIIAAIDLARAAEAPVRVALDRWEEIAVAGYRPETRTELAMALDEEGGFGGMKVRAYGNAGVAVGNAVTIFFRMMYDHRAAPKELKEWDVLTHTPPGQPFRAPGGSPSFWALEQAIDELAEMRGEDPLKLRQRWDTNPPRRALYPWAMSLPAWRQRSAGSRDRGRFRRGVGVAAGGWFHFPQVDVEVDLRVEPGKGLVARSSTQDMGNGTRTVIADAVAAAFGLSPQDVTVLIGDTRFVEGPMSAGSRTTTSLVPAARSAAQALQQELVETLSQRLGLTSARAGLQGIEHDGATIPWPEVFEKADPQKVVRRRPKDAKYFLPLSVDVGGKLKVGRHQTGCLQIVEVEVDTRLGRVRCLEVWGGYGCGRIVSPRLARSQAEGGVIQGMSFALYEERRLDPLRGHLVNGSLEDYRIAGIGDCPVIHTHFEESGFEHAADRTVGLAELVTAPTAAAIGNAVAAATGWRPRSLPLSVDRVLAGVGG